MTHLTALRQVVVLVKEESPIRQNQRDVERLFRYLFDNGNLSVRLQMHTLDPRCQRDQACRASDRDRHSDNASIAPSSLIELLGIRRLTLASHR